MDIQKKKVQFLEKHRASFVQQWQQFRNQTGYLKILVEEDFTYKVNFKHGSFDTDSFALLSSNTGTDLDVVDAEFMYFEVLWVIDKTKHRFKKMLLYGEIDASEFQRKSLDS